MREGRGGKPGKGREGEGAILLRKGDYGERKERGKPERGMRRGEKAGKGIGGGERRRRDGRG